MPTYGLGGPHTICNRQHENYTYFIRALVMFGHYLGRASHSLRCAQCMVAIYMGYEATCAVDAGTLMIRECLLATMTGACTSCWLAKLALCVLVYAQQLMLDACKQIGSSVPGLVDEQSRV